MISALADFQGEGWKVEKIAAKAVLCGGLPGG